MTTISNRKPEDRLPLLVALLVLLVSLLFHNSILLSIESEAVSLEGLYAAIFDWSAIQTGFLFAVYGFVAGKKDGFVKAVSRTAAMANFRSTLKMAVIVGFLLTLTSMPMIVFPLKPVELGIDYILVSLLLSLFALAFTLFCKVAYIFGMIIRVPDSNDKLAH